MFCSAVMLFTNSFSVYFLKNPVFSLIMTKSFAISIIYHREYYSILGWYLWPFKICKSALQSFLAFMAFLEKICCYSDGTDLYKHICINVPLLTLSSFWWKPTVLVIYVCVLVMVLSISSKVLGTVDWYGNIISFA